jgi:hypothetical protein
MSAARGEGTAEADRVVPLHSRRQRRAALAQQVQHVVAAAGLLFSGAQSLSAGAGGLELALAVAGMITGALLLAAFARSVRLTRPAAAHHAHARGVDWMEIWAAAVLLAEAAERWHARHHFPGPQLLTAVITLAIGVFHERVAARRERRRSLRLTADHLHIGRNRFSHFTAPWREIAEIVVSDGEATIRTHKGRTRRLNLADLENAPEVRAALHDAQRRLDRHARLPGSSSGEDEAV